MAAIMVIASFRLKDYDHEPFTWPFYATYDDTNTIAEMGTDLIGLGTLLDAVTDGQIIRNRVTVQYALDVGYKAAPVSGSEIERTGLLNYPLVGLLGKSYSQDIPSFKYSLFTGNAINLADADVAAFNAYMSGSSPLLAYDNTWGYRLGTVLSGRKSFRKHRRQTKRT
jgi:hypothetical protein